MYLQYAYNYYVNILYVIVTVPLLMCTENTALGGHAKRLIV